MPPGTSGAMTIKIPLDPVAGQMQLDQLHDLEFDEAYRRAKRRGETSSPAAAQPEIVLSASGS
jgi:hypothetical protein